MQAIVITPLILAFLVAGCAIFFLLRKSTAGSQTLPVTAEWIDDLSLEQYRPMERLLSGDDLRFLAAQPGCTRRAIRDFRARRCEIFRGYMRSLESDFGRICTAIRFLMVHAQNDRPDLTLTLISRTLSFNLGMTALRFSVLAYQWGLPCVHGRAVLAAFDSLRLELRQMAPADVTSLA